MFDDTFSYTCSEPTNLERPEGGIMTTTEVLEKFLDEVMDEPTEIETAMKSDQGALDQEYRSFLQGKLEYNGHVYDLIKRSMTAAKK